MKQLLEMRRRGVELGIILIIALMFSSLASAQTYDVISNSEEWFVCDADGNAPQFGDLDTNNYIAEYSTFPSKYVGGKLNCTKEAEELYGDPFVLENVCQGNNNCCEADLFHPPFFSNCECTSDDGESLDGCDDDSSEYCLDDPSNIVDGENLILKELCQYGACLTQGANLDPTQPCTDQNVPDSFNKEHCSGESDGCIGGVFIYSDEGDGNGITRDCCVGETADCESGSPELSCESQGGQVCESGEICSSERAILSSEDGVCCSGGSCIPDPLQYQSIPINESYMCYKEDNSNYFAECCYDGKCENWGLDNDRGRWLSFGPGGMFHTLRSYDKYDSDSGDWNDYVRIFRGTGVVQATTLSFLSAYELIDLFNFDYIEFDVMYNVHINRFSEVKIEDQNGNIHSLDPLKDYLINGNATMRWHHAVIDISNYPSLEGVGIKKIFIQTTEGGYFEMAFDNIFLRDLDDSSDNSLTYYCTGAFGGWVNDLDPAPEDITYQEYGPHKFACQSQASFGWTGSYCCGDDTRYLTNAEYFNDINKGCFAGVAVPNDWTVANATNRQTSEYKKILFSNGQFLSCDEDLSSIYQISFDGVSQEGSLIPNQDVTNRDLWNMSGSWFCSPYDVDGNEESQWLPKFNDGWTIANYTDNYAEPLTQILYSDEEFLSCADTSISGILSDNEKDHFFINRSDGGQDWYCDYSNAWNVLIPNDKTIGNHTGNHDYPRDRVLLWGDPDAEAEFWSCDTDLTGIPADRTVNLFEQKGSWFCSPYDVDGNEESQWLPKFNDGWTIANYTDNYAEPLTQILYSDEEFLSCADTSISGILSDNEKDHFFINRSDGGQDWYCDYSNAWNVLIPNDKTIGNHTGNHDYPRDRVLLWGDPDAEAEFWSCDTDLTGIPADRTVNLFEQKGSWYCDSSRKWKQIESGQTVANYTGDYSYPNTKVLFDSDEFWSCNTPLAGFDEAHIDPLLKVRGNWYCALNSTWVPKGELEAGQTLANSSQDNSDPRSWILYQGSLWNLCNFTLHGPAAATVQSAGMFDVVGDYYCARNHSWMPTPTSPMPLSNITSNRGLDDKDRMVLYTGSDVVACDATVKETKSANYDLNILYNPGFEEGMASWSVEKGSSDTATVFSEISLNFQVINPHSGSKMFMLNDVTLSGYPAVLKHVPVNPDTEYSLSAYVYEGFNSAGNKAAIDLYCCEGVDVNCGRCYGLGNGPNDYWIYQGDGGWKNIHVFIETNSTQQYIKPRFTSLPDTTGIFLLDDAWLTLRPQPEQVLDIDNKELLEIVSDDQGQDWYCALNHSWMPVPTQTMPLSNWTENRGFDYDDHSLLYYYPDKVFYSCNAKINETYDEDGDGFEAFIQPDDWGVSKEIFNITGDYYCGRNHSWMLKPSVGPLSNTTGLSELNDVDRGVLFDGQDFFACNATVKESFDGDENGAYDYVNKITNLDLLDIQNDYYCWLNHSWLQVPSSPMPLSNWTNNSELSDYDRMLLYADDDFTSCAANINELYAEERFYEDGSFNFDLVISASSDRSLPVFNISQEHYCARNHSWITPRPELNQRLSSVSTTDYANYILRGADDKFYACYYTINETYDGNENGTNDLVIPLNMTMEHFQIDGEANWYCTDTGWQNITGFPITRLIASKLYDVGKNYENFSLQCGFPEAVLNEPGSALEDRAYCVLRANNSVFVGTSIGIDSTIFNFKDYFSTELANYYPMNEEDGESVDFSQACDNLEDAEFTNDAFFQECQDVGDHLNISINKPFGIAIVTLKETEFYPNAFTRFFATIWDGISDFFENLFGTTTDIEAEPIPTMIDVASFDELYIKKVQDKMIKGIREGNNTLIEYINASDVSFLEELTRKKLSSTFEEDEFALSHSPEKYLYEYSHFEANEDNFNALPNCFCQSSQLPDCCTPEDLQDANDGCPQATIATETYYDRSCKDLLDFHGQAAYIFTESGRTGQFLSLNGTEEVNNFDWRYLTSNLELE